MASARSAACGLPLYEVFVSTVGAVLVIVVKTENVCASDTAFTSARVVRGDVEADFGPPSIFD